jgi:arylsulfatase A-like enzyme
MEQLEHLRRQLATAAPGNAHFAHVLLPHYPYLYRSDCKLREPDGWLSRTSESAPAGMSNTPETRVERYDAYLDQVECVINQLASIFDTMREAGTYRDALIIVHGDHGSRINLIDPSIDAIDRMADSDFLDAFSTLFAIKVPGIEPGYDLSVRSIQELVTDWASADFNALPNRVDDGPARVFLDGSGDTWVRHPFRGFGVAKP